MRPFRPPRQSVDRPARNSDGEQVSLREKASVCRTSDSEEPTEFGLVWGKLIVKETEELGEKTTKDHIETVEGDDKVLQIETNNTSPDTSPNVLEFENYLEGLISKEDSRTALSSVDATAMSVSLPATKPAHMNKDEWWESVLRAEQEKLKKMEESRLVPVDEMFLDPVSSDDDIPIVNTLPATTAKAKKKKKVKILWSYETVLEPTGVRSNYWDAKAPTD
jgi:hypothetical protein